MNSVFEYLDYKKFLSKLVNSSKQRGFQSRLAEAAGCQTAYFSRVINYDAHLTSEQALRVALFLDFRESEINYFLDMLTLSKAGTSELKTQITRRLHDQKKAQEELSNRYQTQSMDQSASERIYYSSWYWSAIHILVSIPQFRTSSAIAARLGLPPSLVNEVLSTLGSFGFVQRRGDAWTFSSNQLHIGREAVMSPINHLNWRLKAVEDARLKNDESLHYTVVHSHGIADFAAIKKLLMQSIDATREIVRPAPDEEISCICIDLFRP
jgi:uncharacterized protein (TIGR02147 family)